MKAQFQHTQRRLLQAGPIRKGEKTKRNRVTQIPRPVSDMLPLLVVSNESGGAPPCAASTTEETDEADTLTQ